MHKDAAHAGQAIYTPLTLALYDQAVLGVSCRGLWRCPSHELLANYQRHIRPDHLDVGVGTGYFLDKVSFSGRAPRIALMDLNPDSLSACAKRIRRYQPVTHQCNVLEPVTFPGERFGSLGMNLLLHCLPGEMSDKACALDNLLPLMNPGATVFGATLLQGGVERSVMAKGLMALYNAKGVFNNAGDSLAGLRHELECRLDTVSVKAVGCMGVFSGTVRQSDSV